jgi:Tol biopolymer transport system component
MRRGPRVRGVVIGLVVAGVALAVAAGATARPVRGKIAFIREVTGGRSDIWTINADGSGLTRLTHDNSRYVKQGDLAWSPDRGKLAFRRDETNGFGDYSRIWVVNANGTRLHTVTSAGTFEDHPTWSPDSRRIAFNRDDRLIYIKNADGTGTLTQLAPIPGQSYFNFPDWSRANRLAFQCKDPNRTKICAENPDGSGQAVLTVGGNGGRYEPRGDFQPAWSPNSRKLAFAAGGNDDAYGVHAVVTNANGAVRRDVSRRGVGLERPKWSPDSRSLLFTTAAGTFIARLNAFNAPVSSRMPCICSQPTWAPDSAHIAYISRGDLWLVQLGVRGQHFAPVQLTRTAIATERQPVFSPS